MSLIGDPLSGAPPSKEPFRTPLLGARPEFQTNRLTGIWAASWKGARHGPPPQAHPLGPNPSADGEVPEEVHLVDLWEVSGHPYER
ncbi:hypothetical protein RGQ21_31670 [Kitasatospora aureofaciens]|nr:hypothetical protein RGQ21_31670 [Kitasatospora aureofaciens]